MPHENSDSGWFCYLPVTGLEIAQGAFLTSVGWQIAPAGAPYPPPGHPENYAFTWENGRMLSEWMVIFVDSGEGQVETRRMKANLRAGDVLYIPPGRWHRYRPSARTGWQVRWISFNGENLHRLRNQEVLADQTCVMPDQPEAMATFSRLAAAVRSQRRTHALVLTGLTMELIGHLLVPEIDVASLLQKEDQVVSKAISFLRGNCHRPIAVDDVAKAVAVSRRTLERRFNEQNGSPIITILRGFRMERARALLLDTHLAVKEIAYLCGFHDVRSFIRTFKGEYGTAPGKWRDERLDRNR